MELSTKDKGGLGSGSRLVVWGAAAALMVLPVLAMRPPQELTSDPGDFMFLAILLAGFIAAFEVAARVPDRRAYAAGAGLALACAFLQSWINLAVGIIGTEDNPANLVYAGVIAVGAGGVLLSRLRPPGMARAMVAAAIAQGIAFLVALAGGLGFTGPITVFFTGLWLISAWLFARAARAGAAAGARA